MQNCFGLGIGLGLPSALMHPSRSAEETRDCRVPSDMLYPLGIHSRHASEATAQLDGLVSYWSPMSDDGEEGRYDEEDYEQDIPADFTHHEDRQHGQVTDESVRPAVQLAPHACLHFMSPKLEALATAAVLQGASAEETVSTALEWAWLVPMLDTSSKEQALPHAPAMLHMPSIDSLASSSVLSSNDGQIVPSIATSSYQSDMARSHSLLSSFSVASFSTTASSVASTSRSVLDRKRPLPSRAASSNVSSSQVIKLRSRSYQRAVQRDFQAAGSLTRRDTKMSVVSQKASIHCSSPSDDELECMVFEPMEQLPSPSMSSSSVLESVHCTCDSVPEHHSSLPSEDHLPGPDTLLELWAATENAERQRKLKKPKPSRKVQSPTVAAQGAERVQKWVSRMRQATNLGRHSTRKEGGLTAVVDPLAWAEGIDTRRKEDQLDALLEPPVMARKEIKGIEQVLRSAPVQRTASPLEERPGAHIWEFLG